MTTKKKKKDDRRYGSFWICPSCDNAEFEHAAMMAHLRDVHQVDTKAIKGTRVMTMHMDGDKWFSSSYDWTLGDLTLHQHTCTKRERAWG